MNAKIKDVPVKDVEADELWGFVQFNRHKLCKEEISANLRRLTYRSRSYCETTVPITNSNLIVIG